MWQVMIESLQNSTPKETALVREKGTYRAPAIVQKNIDDIANYIEQHGPSDTATIATALKQNRCAIYSRLLRMKRDGLVENEVEQRSAGFKMATWRLI